MTFRFRKVSSLCGIMKNIGSPELAKLLVYLYWFWAPVLFYNIDCSDIFIMLCKRYYQVLGDDSVSLLKLQTAHSPDRKKRRKFIACLPIVEKRESTFFSFVGTQSQRLRTKHPLNIHPHLHLL